MLGQSAWKEVGHSGHWAKQQYFYGLYFLYRAPLLSGWGTQKGRRSLQALVRTGTLQDPYILMHCTSTAEVVLFSTSFALWCQCEGHPVTGKAIALRQL